MTERAKVALHGAEPTLASCVSDGALRLWDEQSWTVSRAVRAPAGDYLSNCEVLYTADSEQILTVTQNSGLRVWGENDLTLQASVVAPDGSAQGNFRLSGTADTEDGQRVVALGAGTYLYCVLR